MAEVEYWKNSDSKDSGKNQERVRSGCCVHYLVLVVEQVNDSSQENL